VGPPFNGRPTRAGRDGASGGALVERSFPRGAAGSRPGPRPSYPQMVVLVSPDPWLLRPSYPQMVVLVSPDPWPSVRIYRAQSHEGSTFGRIARRMVAPMKATALLSALLLTTAIGCKKSESDKAPAPVAAKAPAEPPPPGAPTYSPAAAKDLVADLSKCTTPSGCDPFDTLVGFGAQAAAEVLTLAVDATATSDARRLAAGVLEKLKAPAAGLPLITAANAVADDSMLQGDLYEAAGASGGQPVFDALIAEYVKAMVSTDDNRDIPLRGGLRAFPAESVAWVKANLPKAKEDHASYTDLITDSATAADLPTIVELLGATKVPMARHRLAAKAIELGDLTHFGAFVDGLKSKDQYDRSDAANFLADIADKAPAAMKPELIDLLQKGKAGDAGGMTAMGYDNALKKLGAP